MAIALKAVGTAATGTGTVAPAWPTHVSGDVALLFVQTYDAAATLSTANGFTVIYHGGDSVNAYITVFWARATSASMTAPVVADAGDHSHAVIITFSGVTGSGDPVDDWSFTGTQYTNNISFDNITTTVDGCAVIYAEAWAVDSAGPALTNITNIGLTGLAELYDAGTTTGTGGGIAVWMGTDTVAGAVPVATGYNTTGFSPFGTMTIALKPQTGQSVSVPVGSLTLTGYAPIVTTASAGPVVSVPVGTLTLTGYAPTVRMGDWIDETDVSTTWTDIEGN